MRRNARAGGTTLWAPLASLLRHLLTATPPLHARRQQSEIACPWRAPPQFPHFQVAHLGQYVYSICACT